MAFVVSTSFLPSAPCLNQTSVCRRPPCRHTSLTTRVQMTSTSDGAGSGDGDGDGNGDSNSDGSGAKKPASRSRRFQPGKTGAAAIKKKKLEPETVFMNVAPSRLELIVPTISILTVIGIIPFAGAVARALWVRYKFTSRRIAISSGFQGKDQTEIIYRDIECVKYIRRLGGAADCVFTLKDGAKLEIRAVPEFEKVFAYIMERVSDETREASGSA